MQRMLPATRAILLKLQPVRIVASILLRYVIAFFTVIACQDDNRADIFLFRSHATLTTLLLDDLGDDTRADGETAFANGELGTLLERHRDDQGHGQVDVVAW